MATANLKPEAGLAELKQFIETAKLDASALNNINDEAKLVYKRFYALLVYDHILQGNLTCLDQKTYGKEAVSDMSHGFFLTCIGLYKPARASMRGSLENLVRFLLMNRGVAALKITSVYDLFDAANAEFDKEPKQKARIGTLRSLYKELCKTVHSASKNHMNLEVPFNTMLQFDQVKYDMNLALIRDCCKVSGELLFIEFNELVERSHHSQKDILLDSVARTIRKEARELREQS